MRMRLKCKMSREAGQNEIKENGEGGTYRDYSDTPHVERRGDGDVCTASLSEQEWQDDARTEKAHVKHKLS